MIDAAILCEPDWESAIEWEAVGERAVTAAVSMSQFARLIELDTSIEIAVRLTTNAEVQDRKSVV